MLTHLGSPPPFSNARVGIGAPNKVTCFNAVPSNAANPDWESSLIQSLAIGQLALCNVRMGGGFSVYGQALGKACQATPYRQRPHFSFSYVPLSALLSPLLCTTTTTTRPHDRRRLRPPLHSLRSTRLNFQNVHAARCPDRRPPGRCSRRPPHLCDFSCPVYVRRVWGGLLEDMRKI